MYKTQIMKLKTITFLLTAIVFFAFSSESKAQKIVQFSQYRIVKSEYGATKIQIRPHTRKGNSNSKYNSSFGVYGVLICYKVDGKQKAARQDMTYDLKNKGKYEFGLAYSKNSKVSGVSVQYFNMVDTPKNNWPQKSKCFR